MILYTPLHEQEIFYNEDENESFQWVTVNSATLKLKRDEELGGYQIVHMVSTNPTDYLNKNIQPGSIIYL